MDATNRRVGRRRGPSSTKQEILDAARELFAAKGFRGTTMRAVAQAASVDPALVHHYFGDKEGLFGATLELPEDVPARVLGALAGGQDGVGERVTRAYLELWEAPETRDQMAIVVRAALSDEHAMARLRSVIAVVLSRTTEALVASPDREVRLALAMSQLLGVALGRYVAQVPPLRDLDFEVLVARVAPVVEGHLTGEHPLPG